jgi:hypothetical protein
MMHKTIFIKFFNKTIKKNILTNSKVTFLTIIVATPY